MLVDVVSEKIQFCDTKEAFVGVDDDAMLVEAVENRSQVFEVLFGGVASDEDVVDVYVGEGDTSENLVHESLECLCCIPQTKWHAHELE